MTGKNSKCVFSRLYRGTINTESSWVCTQQMRDYVTMLTSSHCWVHTQNDPCKSTTECIYSINDLGQKTTPNQTTNRCNGHQLQWSNVDIGQQHKLGIFPLERLMELLSQNHNKSITSWKAKQFHTFFHSTTDTPPPPYPTPTHHTPFQKWKNEYLNLA